MRVCYCLATTDLEGGAKSLLDLLDCMRKIKKVRIYILLTKHHEGLENKLKHMKINYKVIYHGTDCVTKNKLKQFCKLNLNKLAKVYMKKFFIKNKIDIIHNNSVLSLIAMEAASELKIPYICHVREDIDGGLNLKMLNYDLLYKLMNNSNYCVYISDFIEKKYEKFITADNGIVIYDGINFKNYLLKTSEIIYNYNNLLLVGRISKGKCQLDAVKAINILKNKYKNKYYLTIIGTIGDQDYYDEIINFININSLNDQIKLLPYADDLEEIRKNCRISLVCSENEGLGRVTIESMLSRQLVIGAASGATCELIDSGENGYLYELHNVNELANLIKNTSDVNTNKLIENGFDFANEFFDNMLQTEKIYEIYLNILGGENENNN